ncbi:MAG: hypothetical protein ACYSYU_02550 [Planctomycetota bacterium]|jgi:hypothetical protein
MAINIPVFQARPIDETGIGDFLNPLMQAVRQKQQSDASESRFARELQLKHDQLAEQQKYHQEQIDGINKYRTGMLAAQQIKANAPPELSRTQQSALIKARQLGAGAQETGRYAQNLVSFLKSPEAKPLFTSGVQAAISGIPVLGPLEKALARGNKFNVARNKFESLTSALVDNYITKSGLPKTEAGMEAARQAVLGGLHDGFSGWEQGKAAEAVSNTTSKLIGELGTRAKQYAMAALDPMSQVAPMEQPQPQDELSQMQNQRAEQQRQFEMMQAKLKELGG